MNIAKVLKLITPTSYKKIMRGVRDGMYRFSDSFQPHMTSRAYMGFRLFYIKGPGLIDRIRFGAPDARYEPHICGAIEREINDIKKQNPIFFDIGANVGLISLSILKQTNSVIHAFEPGRKQFSTLQATIASNDLYDRVQAYQIAFSDINGVADFFASSEFACGSGDGLKATGRVGKTDTYKVESKTMNEWCKIHNIYPDVIKIDTEGSEKFILDGAKSVLEKGPVIFIEISPLNLSSYPYKAKDILALLNEYGYRVSSIVDSTIATQENIETLAGIDDMFIAKKI